jgi:ribose 5-phosphate isomerase
MDKHIVVGVHITQRVKHASEVQKVFTEFGCQIRTRLGLHEADKGVCSPNGLIILDMVDDAAKVASLKKKLTDIEGVEVQSMVFDHA